MNITWKTQQTIKDNKNSIKTQAQNQECQDRKYDTKDYEGKKENIAILPPSAKNKIKEGVDLQMSRMENLSKSNNYSSFKRLCDCYFIKIILWLSKDWLG